MGAQTVIIGGGIASLRLAQQLRRAGDEDPITIVCAEQTIAYDRPPLSKSVLLDKAVPRPDLISSEGLDTLGVRTMAGRRALRLDRAGRSVELTTGEALPYDDLVIATGSAPRRLPALDAADPHYLRTWDDALALREALHGSERVGVIGAGVLGLETAATARALGREVLVIDAAPHALARLGPPDVGRAVADLHREHGVRLRFDITTETAVRHDDGTITLRLSDGTEEVVDALVVAIGAAAVTDWLDGSGLEGQDGVDTDTSCRTADERIHAIGDVARIEYVPGAHRRLEHWTNAGDTAAVAARSILARRRRDETRPILTELPYVWSDQYDVKLQILGHLDADANLLSAVEDPEAGRWLRIAARGHEVTGVVGWNMPAAVNRCRAALMAGITVEELLSKAPWERKVHR